MGTPANLLPIVLVLGIFGCPSAPRQSGRSATDGSDQPTEADQPTELGNRAELRSSQDQRIPQKVFRAQVAASGGQGFYTSDAAELRQQLKVFLENAETATELQSRDLVGLISPHAGYRYAGPAAAHGYRQLQGREYRTVVVLGLSHRRRARKIAVLNHDVYRTPLGDVPIDKDVVRQLVEADSDLLEVSELPFQGEHSLEIQLPFLQLVLGEEFRLVPIILATGREDHSERLAQLLHQQLGRRRDVLVIASTDLTHHYPYEQASRMDREILRLITTLDFSSYRERGPLPREMPCGYYTVLTLMHFVSLYEPTVRRATLLQYQNSGDTAGDRSAVVGYGAVAFSLDETIRTEVTQPTAEPGPSTALARRFGEEDRRSLMEIARSSVAAAVRGELLLPRRPDDGIQTELGAAFVTLRCETNDSGRCVGQGEGLRGCIGHIVARVPLYRCIHEVARSAAISDRRFPPLTEVELEYVSYEISVLTPPEVIEDPNSVVVGRDGLIMERDGRRGLLLPQVPIEWGWNRETFLARTCRKAQMESTCWSDQRTRIERFGAVVWGEDLVAHDRY